MTSSPLPTFRYHPDPIQTGEVVASVDACVCCGQERGYLYTGPVHGKVELDGLLCPWCIADGAAAEGFDVTFVDVGWGIPPGVSPSVLKTLSERTPSFTAWQQEHWLYHCDDAAAFFG